MRLRSRAAPFAALLALTAAAAHAQSALPAPPPPVLTVTIDEAVRRALAASPEVARDTGAVRVARAAERSARAAFLPTVSLESNVLRSTNPGPFGQPGALPGAVNGTSAAGLGATYDLFTGGRRGAEIRRAAATRDVSDADLVARRYAVSLDAERAAFDVLRAAAQRRVQSARVARAVQGESYAKRRHDAGVATRSDELRARLELSRARQALAQTEGQFRTARYAFGRVVGVDGAVDVQEPDSLAPRALSLDDSALVRSS